MTALLAPAYGIGGSGGGGGSSTGGLAVVVSPAPAYGARASSAAVTVSSENVTAAITGGSGTYTITWEVVVITTGTWTITAPNALITKFSAAAVPNSATRSATFRARVSDGATTIYSSNVDVTCENTGTS